MAIFTTNYDLVLERAYQQQRNPVQTLKVLVSDAEAKGSTSLPHEVTYYKLHGCITHYHTTCPPLVATTSQIINARSGRVGLFERFLEVSKNYTCVFVGYSFQDANMQVLVDELIKDGDNHPPHYILNKSMTEVEGNFWHERRFRPITGSFAAFLEHLSDTLPDAKRKLAVIGARMRTTGLTRWISVSRQSEF